MNIQVDQTRSNLVSAMLNSKIRPRAVVGYGVKIFLPSPPNYVTRSPGRRWCFGTCPSPLAENDNFEAEIAPLPSIYHRVAKKRARWPTILIGTRYYEINNQWSQKKTKTMLMQNLGGGTNKEYYGIFRSGLLIQGYFCAVQTYAEIAELSKCSCYPKRKLGVTMNFSEIIKLEFGKDCHTLLCILKLFYKYCWLFIFEKRGYPRFSFWISVTLVKIWFSSILSKLRKNIFELVGTVLNREPTQGRRRLLQYCHKAIGLINKNNGSASPARAFYILIHFLAVLVLTTTWNDQTWGSFYNFKSIPRKRREKKQIKHQPSSPS